jgi:hypothetical protein
VWISGGTNDNLGILSGLETDFLGEAVLDETVRGADAEDVTFFGSDEEIELTRVEEVCEEFWEAEVD